MDGKKAKVLKWLETCVKCTDIQCGNCPYFEDCDNNRGEEVPSSALDDVLEVLRADKPEPRLLTLKEAQTAKGIGWEEVWFRADEDEGEPEGVELFECVFINGHIRGADGDVGEVDESTYNQPYHSRLWLGADKPTVAQRTEAKWHENTGD